MGEKAEPGSESGPLLGLHGGVHSGAWARGAHSAPDRVCHYVAGGSARSWGDDAPLTPFLSLARIRSLSPLPRARRPEPSGPGFSSWTRNTGGDGDALTPGAQEEKLRNNPLAGPTCMQARTRVSGNLGSGCRPPVSSGASTCQRRGPSPGRRPLGCGDLASCPSSIATPTGPGNNDLRGL